MTEIHRRPPGRHLERQSQLHSRPREREVFAAGRMIAVRERQMNRAKLIPEMRRNAGRLVRKVRTTATKDEIPSQEFGESMNVNTDTLQAFERGRRTLDLHMVYLVAKDYSDPDAVEIRELRELRNHVEEEQIMSILNNSEMTIGKTIKLLRLSELASITEFAKKTGISTARQMDYEFDRKPPIHTILEKIIDTSKIDPETMPAQLIRLKRTSDEPMTLTELQECTLGQLVKYLRVLKGTTRQELGKKLYCSGKTIESMENTQLSPPAGRIDNLISWLQLTPESALAKVISLKAQKSEDPIPEEMFEGVLTQQYLFKEHLQHLGDYPLTIEDTELMEKLQNEASLGKMVKYMMTQKEHGILQGTLARKIKMPKVVLWDTITEKSIPKDTTIVRIAMGLGYSITHPVTQFLLRRAEQDRAYATYTPNLLFSADEAIEEVM